MGFRLNKLNTLSGKVLTAIGIAFTLLFLGQWSIAKFIISNSYSHLEKAQTITNAERLTQVLSQEVDNLVSTSRDWAWWDDTYKFAQDGNQAYIDNNLAANALLTLSLDFFVIFNNDNELVYGQMLDLESEELIDQPLNMLSDLAPHVVNLNQEEIKQSKAGFSVIDQQPTLLSIQQILTNNRTGPVQGILIMGRLVYESRLNSFTETTR